MEEHYYYLSEKYSKENFLLFLINKKKQLSKDATDESHLSLEPRDFIKKATQFNSMQELLSEVMENLPLDDREYMAHLKSKYGLW